jgi:hypothetical protein
MSIVASDWSISRSTGDIRYIGNDHGGGSPSYATVIEFHRFLQDLADDASSAGDDEIDITDENPSARSTDNIITLLGNYNIDDNASEHLYDGSIIQNGGDDIYDGIVNFGNSGVVVQIHQNGGVLTDDWWNANSGLNADAVQGISHRFMLPTRVGGSDIDGKRLLGITREFNKTYSEFPINGTSRGNNVLALSNSDDLNNATAEGVVSGWSDVTNTSEGYTVADIDNDSINEEYFSFWDRGSRSINDFYERMKWLTRDGSASTIYGLNGELFRGITHEIDIDGATGTFNDFEAVSWTGGTGQMLAIDSTTTGTKMWIQLLTGSVPSDNDTITGGTSAATADMNVTVTARTISVPFVGASTGSALIGSYGFGVEGSDLTASDKLTDLTATLRVPPNNVTFSVGGLVSSEDRILVAPWDGASTDVEGNPAIDKSQFSLSGSLTSGSVTSITIGTTIPSDTPATGSIRVELDDGSYKSVSYTSYVGSTFTVSSSDFATTNATTANNVWVAYIDTLAGSSTETFSSIYSSDRDLVVILRDGGISPIKQFISSATLGSSGGSITVIRTSDE